MQHTDIKWLTESGAPSSEILFAENEIMAFLGRMTSFLQQKIQETQVEASRIKSKMTSLEEQLKALNMEYNSIKELELHLNSKLNNQPKLPSEIIIENKIEAPASKNEKIKVIQIPAHLRDAKDIIYHQILFWEKPLYKNEIIKKMKEIGRPIKPTTLSSYLSIDKRFKKIRKNLWGLSEWGDKEGPNA